MAENQNNDAILKDLAEGRFDALDFLAAVNIASMEASGLDPETLMLVRIAVLAALDAPVASWVMNLSAAGETDITLEQLRGTLLAIAPLIGTPRVVSASGKMLEAIALA
jgi:alkylhydroperoxidase/carboxymuconolactone decarboxylase family protein YurZ